MYNLAIAGIISATLALNPNPKYDSLIYDNALLESMMDLKEDEGLVKIVLDLNDKKTEKNIRKLIINNSIKQKNAYLFGDTLNDIEYKVREEISKCKENGEDICKSEYEIPKNFILDEMDFVIRVDTKEMTSKIYQEIDGVELLLGEYPVVIGGKNKDYELKKIRDFPTPKGTYYIQRIVREPFYYPPKWDKNQKKRHPGRNNPYGLWMAELSKDNEEGNYSFKLDGDVYGIRIHSTNMPESVKRKKRDTSHGCVRVHPDTADEIFPAFLRYIPHNEMKSNMRGKITPLLKTIKVVIE